MGQMFKYGVVIMKDGVFLAGCSDMNYSNRSETCKRRQELHTSKQLELAFQNLLVLLINKVAKESFLTNVVLK